MSERIDSERNVTVSGNKCIAPIEQYDHSMKSRLALRYFHVRCSKLTLSLELLNRRERQKSMYPSIQTMLVTRSVPNAKCSLAPIQTYAAVPII